jgi:hypothetical protein
VPRLGLPLETAIGVIMIYRLLTFSLPMLLTSATYQRLLGAHRTLGLEDRGQLGRDAHAALRAVAV